MEDKSSEYRRGTILGLTMAEAIILVVFCLLLLQNHISNKKNEQINKLQEFTNEQKTIINRLEKDNQLIESIKKHIAQSGENTFDDAFKELKLLKQKEIVLKKKISILYDKNDHITTIENFLQNHPEFNIGNFKDNLEKYDTFLKIQDQNGNKVSVNDILTNTKTLINDKRNLSGRIKYLQRKLDASGRGTEKPSCWVTSEGRPEYLFMAALTSSGIVLHDNVLPNRTFEKTTIPLNKIPFDQELTTKNYRSVTRKLYDWSVINECRFFVKVFDRTESSEKVIYKKHLRILGEHFYYYEPLNEKAEWLTN